VVGGASERPPASVAVSGHRACLQRWLLGAGFHVGATMAMRKPLAALTAAVLTVGMMTAATAATASAESATPSQPAVGSDPELPGLTPVVPVEDALTGALEGGDISTARYALERARSLFTPRVIARRYGDLADLDPRQATLILRDLALRADQLAPEARRQAHTLLSRPTDGFADPDGAGYSAPQAAQTFCTTNVCAHWVTTTTDAPPLTDSDGDGSADWAQTTATDFQHVWDTEVGGYGYRAPKSDLFSTNDGGDPRLDVYLADLGADNLYGYCTTDDPAALTATRFFDVSAYCVVDNDFASTQFPTSTPRNNLRVTAAHEFFHAVQFAYDAAEDLWLMEGSAAWIEDEVYDDVNDNLQYLPGGPLTHPHRSLDGGLYEPWIFFRFLAEYFGTATTDRPVVVRQVWERADSAPGGPDAYSLQALAQVTAARGTPLREAFADFGWTGPLARSVYAEGSVYPRAPMTSTFTLTSAAPSSGARALTLNHLANRHIAFNPGASLPTQRRLKVTVNGPDRARGTEATLVVLDRDGDVHPLPVAIDAAGNGTRTVSFNRATIARVYLTLTNASTRYACWYGTGLACMGIPTDDGQRFTYSARTIS
jgi:hypothetical protein